MADKRPATRKEMLVIGLIAGGAGLFFVLVGLGIIPPPGGKKICTRRSGWCSARASRSSLAAVRCCSM